MDENTGLSFGHDPHIYKDKTGKYYIYSTDTGINGKPIPGGQIRASNDLIHWEFIGRALPDGAPDEVYEHTKSRHIWAPDIICVNGEIRMYLSVSTFGSQNSAIILAVSDNPEGPFEYRGIVLKTKNGDPVNAIDANIIADRKTGAHYMAYGSFWGGIRLLELDNETGLAKESGFGKPLCSRPRSVEGAVEGAYIIYNEQTEYYYLFVSYDSLTNFYNVRVGRSREINGDYIDYNGVKMTDHSNPYDTGLKIMTGFQFGDSQGYMAPGHNSVLNDNGNWYIIHHIRKDKELRGSFMQIRKMYWTNDGWPLVNPIPYQPEYKQPLQDFEIAGLYDRILFNNKPLRTAEKSIEMTLSPDGSCRFDCNEGRWSVEDNILTACFSNHTEKYFIECTYNEAANQNIIALTGITNGTCIWAVSSGQQKGCDCACD